MPKYRIVIDRVEWQQGRMEVEAATEEKAKEVAMEQGGCDHYETENTTEEVVSVKEIP
jgi:hypothetical protein